MAVWVGLDIGGTKCAAVCAHILPSGQPEILHRVPFLTADFPEPYAMLQMLDEAVRKMCAAIGDAPLGIGISCGGPLDSRAGRILSPPNLPGWDSIPIVSYYKERYGVPVFLQNDANACAVAEWKFGAGKGCRNMVFLTFGTGLGAGLILDGKLYRGTNDLAGEAGHIRLAQTGPVGYGKSGSFEGFCSGGGIERLAQERLPSFLACGGETVVSAEDLSAKTIAFAAAAGDGFAKSIYTESGRFLGKGLAILIDLLNPERIVIGSIYARSVHLLYDAMMESLREEALETALSVCRIVPAALGEQIGDYAALGVLVCGLETKDD